MVALRVGQHGVAFGFTHQRRAETQRPRPLGGAITQFVTGGILITGLVRR